MRMKRERDYLLLAAGMIVSFLVRISGNRQFDAAVDGECAGRVGLLFPCNVAGGLDGEMLATVTYSCYGGMLTLMGRVGDS